MGNTKHYYNVSSRTVIEVVEYEVNEGGMFSFGKRMWKQRRGLPMGNPISSQMAELMLIHQQYKYYDKGNVISERWCRFKDNILVGLKCTEREREGGQNSRGQKGHGTILFNGTKGGRHG